MSHNMHFWILILLYQFQLMNLEVCYVFGASLVSWFMFVSSIINQNPPRHEERRGMMVKGILRKMRFLLLSKCRMKSRQKIKPSSMMPIHMSFLWVLAKFLWIWTKQNFGNTFLQKYHFSHGQLGLTWHKPCGIGQLRIWTCLLVFSVSLCVKQMKWEDWWIIETEFMIEKNQVFIVSSHEGTGGRRLLWLERLLVFDMTEKCLYHGWYMHYPTELPAS